MNGVGQPADSLQAKCFVSWAMTGGELVAVPIFRSCMTFARSGLVKTQHFGTETMTHQGFLVDKLVRTGLM